MRINGLQLAGLAVALVGVSAKDALAADVTVSNSTTTPLVTSHPDGVSPGNITITSGGSIAITTGQTAVTIDSNNTVSNAGSLKSTDVNTVNGILLGNGFTGAVTNTGTINLTETYARTDTNGDNVLDGAFAQGFGRIGIFQNTGDVFHGDISNSGSILIQGNNSAGISLGGTLDGDFTNTGTLQVIGDNAVAIGLNAVTGDAAVRGTIAVEGLGAHALVVSGPIGGELRINGSWSDTGYSSIARPTDTSTLNAGNLLQSGSAIEVNGSVAGGITIEGVGVDKTDSSTDTTVTDTTSASIISYSGSPALAIDGTTSNIVIGANPDGFGVHIRGALSSFGIYNGFDTTAVRIQGQAGASVTIANSLTVDSAVSAAAAEANAFGVYIGADVDVPEILVRRQISSTSTSDTAQTAYGIYLDANAQVPAINNSGTISAQLFGEVGNATAIVDHSNTLATITNSGTIRAVIVATDSDPTDNIPPPPITGVRTAIDVSGSSIGVTLNQVAATPISDPNVNTTAIAPPIQITGDIRFGSGADTVNLGAGEIDGNISFGNGADTFNVTNGAVYSGQVTDSDGALTIHVTSGTLALLGGPTNITTATFNNGAQLGVLMSETPGASELITASGTVTFDPGSRVVPLVPAGLPDFGTHTFLTANGGLIGASNVVGAITGADTPYVYNLSVDVVSGDPNSLEANYILKTPAQLGLGTSQSAAFDPIITALRNDDAASAAFSNVQSQADFRSVYAQLMPSYTSASTELATTAIQQEQSATTNRLAATRLANLNEVSAWAQEIGYGLNRQSPDINGQDFRGHGFGIATGIDGPLDNGALFGLSASFITSDAEEPARPDGEISSSFGQFSAYLGTALGPIDLDVVGGLGVGKMRSRRFIEIGSSFKALAEADWWAWEGHGLVRASMPLRAADWLIVTPQVSLTYVGLNEQGYTEDGAGALDYDADSSFAQRLWADAGVEFAVRMHLRGQTVIAPRISIGYRANVITDGGDRTFRFTGGSDFTLADDDYGSGGPVVGVGVDATNGYTTFTLAYEGEFTDQIERHSLNAALRFRF